MNISVSSMAFLQRTVLAVAFALTSLSSSADNKELPVSNIKIVDYAAAQKRYALPDWMSKDWVIIVHEGDLVVKRHLLVDWVREGTIAAEQAVLLRELLGVHNPRGAYGVVIDGNLAVTGSILNVNMDGGPTLIVTGETKARSLLAGGAYFSFAGKTTFTEAIFADYNHGETIFHGPVSAPLLINSDHALDLRHSSRHESIGVYFNDMEDDCSSEDLYGQDLPQGIAAVIKPDITSLSDIREALESGRYILR